MLDAAHASRFARLRRADPRGAHAALSHGQGPAGGHPPDGERGARPARARLGGADRRGGARARRSSSTGASPGPTPCAPLKLPAGEKLVPVPYGRPPSLLSVEGPRPVERPFPPAGKPLDKPIRVPGVASTPTLRRRALAAALRARPAGGPSSALKQPKGVVVLGVSQEQDGGRSRCRRPSRRRRASDAAPAASSSRPCSEDGPAGDVALAAGHPHAGGLRPRGQVRDPAERAVPALAGAAQAQHRDRRPTEQGILGVMSARAGDRWGLYLAQGPETAPSTSASASSARARATAGASSSAPSSPSASARCSSSPQT